MMTIGQLTQSLGDKSMKAGPGFGSVIWIVFGISAFSTLLVTLTVRLLFRRNKQATDL
jgi:hypothetical protein